jgi:hypothetical protein
VVPRHRGWAWRGATCLVGIFGVEVVFNCYVALFPKVVRCNLHKICYLGLIEVPAAAC